MVSVLEAPFAGARLLSAPGRVMVPRPASERLVAQAAARLGGRLARVADVGTGSGAIAVALALRIPGAHVWASDINPFAVALTRVNAARQGVAGRVHPVVGDLLEPVSGPLDLVVANLPYLPDRLAGDPAYAEYRLEPDAAMFAPGDGLDPYRRLLEQAERELACGGALLVQFRRRVFSADRDALDVAFAELFGSCRPVGSDGRAGRARASWWSAPPSRRLGLLAELEAFPVAA
jgi:HemK-like putative methylase